MKKKVTALCAVLAVIGGMIPSAFAADVPEKTEISFKVGDSTLTVNGQPMEVTAPYVVGEGTTLVPIRVITEAFGAEVNWNGEEQSVNLKYPDVDITIKIGSKSAQVNTHAEELLAAPELYNDTTMVPLRFISETFGAKVDYNDGLITVTKEAAKETASTVEGTTDKEFIGDSYYGWTIKNPKNYPMDERSFDGKTTYFDYDSKKSGLSIFVDRYDEDIDADTEFNRLKNEISGGAISIADKKQLSDGYTYIHFRSKSKEGTLDVQAYIKEKTEFSIIAAAYGEDKVDDELFDIAQSFSLNESGRDFYDLSNINDGVRPFEDKDYNISIKLPAEWTQYESSQPNAFVFYDKNDDIGEVSIEVSSKGDGATAEKLAVHDKESKEAIVNSSLVRINDIKSEVINGEKAYSYDVNYNGEGNNNYYFKDVFFEFGDYIYNIAVTSKNKEENDKILDTFKASAPDSEKIGKIIRSAELAGGGKVNIAGGKLAAKDYWSSVATLGVALREGRSGASITGSALGNIQSGKSPRSMADTMFKSFVESVDNRKSVSSMKTENSNGHTFYIQTYEWKHEDYVSYVTMYFTVINDKAYAFLYSRDDIYYGGGLDNEADEIIKSFEVE